MWICTGRPDQTGKRQMYSSADQLYFCLFQPLPKPGRGYPNTTSPYVDVCQRGCGSAREDRIRQGSGTAGLCKRKGLGFGGARKHLVGLMDRQSGPSYST
ncbi:hypothetical protein Bbelb_123620 [Branchiostoma belcheri]|nr:hypothetical protein Bbelb_123620 [Branchiostoma belcheri]